MTENHANDNSGWWLSPLQVTLLAINALCFGACLVLLVAGRGDGEVVLLTVSTGLMLFAGWAGAVICARQKRRRTTSNAE